MKVRKVSKPAIRTAVQDVAATLNLTPYLTDGRTAFSGQRQRIALGRAMLREPKVFLLDEPLSNLDAALRGTMRGELSRIQSRLGVTAVYVTHDQVEAMTMGSRIVVMKDGYIQQAGAPDTVYGTPANLFVAKFIGSPAINLLPAASHPDGFQIAGTESVVGVPAHLNSIGSGRTGDYVLGLRPEDVCSAPDAPSTHDTVLNGRVEIVEPLGRRRM